MTGGFRRLTYDNIARSRRTTRSNFGDIVDEWPIDQSSIGEDALY